MPVTDDTLRVLADLRRQLDETLAGQQRDLVAAWAMAWDEVAGDLRATVLDITAARADGRVSRAMLIRSERLAFVLQVIAARLDALAEQAGIRISVDLVDVAAAAARNATGLVATQLPAGLGVRFDRVDQAQLAAIVARATQQITSLTRPLSDDAYDAMRRELIRGVAVGSNPRATADRIVKRAEGRFTGGLTRALVIARTETLDAHRAAAQVAHEAQADVLAGWQWVSALDSRSCRACWGKHGTVHDLVEPGPLGHQQCRCARLPVVRSWADLGYGDLDEPDDLLPDADAAFGELSGPERRALLGRDGYQAWLAGRFPRDAWAVRRTTKGWRDSFVPAKPARSGGRVQRRPAA